MDLGLAGRRAIVTGGSRGLGLAVARSLVAEGAAVGLVARDADDLATAADTLRRAGGTVAVCSADVTDFTALTAATDAIAAELGGLDLVVANVGGTVGGNLLDAEASDFVATYALNAGHAAALTKAAVPHLRTAGGGAAVFVASVTGLRPAPRTAYAAAKAGEIHLAATLAVELAADRIRVNAVSPGSILFPGGNWERYREEHPQEFADWVDRDFPHGRLGRAEEVGDVVAFLLSDRSSWITGANLVVDGAQGYPSARRFR